MKFKKEICFLGILGSFIFGYIFALNNLEIKKEKENFAPQNSQTKNIQENKKLYDILNIFDGDTIKIIYKNKKTSLRILGINTPEKTGGPYRKKECFGDEASERAREILKDKKISLEFDGSQSKYDKFGRLLAYILIDGKEDFGEKMIRDGFAYEYTYHGQKYKNQKKYKEAQKFAEKNKNGLWADNACAGFEK